jgi:general secretion pathway protein A
MLSDFYGLREEPFGVTPDSRFLYLGPSHREAMASLRYGVEAGRGFVALIAKPGMGKTTLLMQLLERLRGSTRSVFVFQTQCNERELLRHMLTDAGLDAQEDDLVRLHQQFNQLLACTARSGKRFVVVIDEAQNLDGRALEAIRLLSDFETPRAKLLQIVLAGQPQLAEKLASPALTQLRQRISILCRLRPLGRKETELYIGHRLRAAGYEGPPLFTGEALDVIAGQSQGIPRNINNLCFNAMSLGCALGRAQIDASLIEEVTVDLDMETLLKEEFEHEITEGGNASPEAHYTNGAASIVEPLSSVPAESLPSEPPAGAATPTPEPAGIEVPAAAAPDVWSYLRQRVVNAAMYALAISSLVPYLSAGQNPLTSRWQTAASRQSARAHDAQLLATVRCQVEIQAQAEGSAE